MRAATGFFVALLTATGLQAQNQSGFTNPPPNVTRTFGSVVHPGGTSALPGVQRTTGSVVHPAGGTPQIGIPGLQQWQGTGANGNRGWRHNGPGPGVYAYPVAIPVYVGGYDMFGQATAPEAPPQPPQQQQQPNVIVIYPQAPAPVYTYQQPAMPAPQSNMVEVQPALEQSEPAHYLLAFKDHSIYSAVAYWVDGETLHYFTSGNTHNQVSVSLVDRELTKRLNEGSSLEVKLPPAK